MPQLNEYMPEGHYGQELVIDLHKCTENLNKNGVIEFLRGIVKEIDMEAVGDPIVWDDPHSEVLHFQGCSGLQWIKTSNIIIHTLSKSKTAYINIFSCKPFDVDKAFSYTQSHFKAGNGNKQLLMRGDPKIA